MEKIMISIYDHLTGENVVREATDEEIESLETMRKQMEEIEKANKQKQDVRKSALSKLIDLGLTEEEIAAL